MSFRVLFLSLIGSMVLSQSAAAQTWPEKPVRLIVPTGPGSATDLMARLMADEVSKAIGGAVFVDDIPGASGIPAHQAAARAAPDGYTFLFTNTSGLAINPVSFKRLPYDPTKDFSAVAVVADLAPQMVSVNKTLPVHSLPDLIAYGKANLGKVDYAVDATAGGAVSSIDVRR
jgi:tripartite-type tricarboxylate transporter receptor subunit TctC